MDKTPLQVEDGPCDAKTVQRVQSALEAGNLVLLPTETVYGIAARADNADALQKLSQAKGRPTKEPFTWHVGDANSVDLLGPRSASVNRLIHRYWPGPLTLILPDRAGHLPNLSRNGRVGIRFPAHEATASILQALPFPVAMTSANLHGDDPVETLEQLSPGLVDAISVFVEGGRRNMGESSTVLQLGRASGEDQPSFDLLREGLHDLETLRRTAGIRILFVCTGNTCRSPMAEGMARKALAERLHCDPEILQSLGYHISSAGVYAFGGGPASKHSLDQMAQRGVDLSLHRASAATDSTLNDADEIYCLTRAHLDSVHTLLGPKKEQSAVLLDESGADIPDPIGGSARDYERCADRIAECIEARLDSWA